jgi:hypothetical protein
LQKLSKTERRKEMIEKDTIRLLRECDAGIKMGVASIADVYDHAKSEKMRNCLNACKDEHDKLDKELQEALGRFKDEGKNPNIMAKGMSKIKTNAEMVMKPTASQAASLITDGCGMGIKYIHKYMNQYPAAAPEVMNLANRISTLEAKLEEQMKPFL